MKPLSILIGSLITGLAAPAASFDQTHTALEAVLRHYVRDARVDYAGLKASPEALDRYLSQLASVPEADFTHWTQNQRIAFLMNAYNANTLKLIVDHYPVKSIKDIGSFLNGPWDQPVVHLFGRTLTLNTVEHKMLRTDYHEPRTHFALVCAAKGCPPLRGEAYVAVRLDEQLDDQTRQFLANARKNRVDQNGHAIYLSPIFKWYAEDFAARSGSVQAFLKPYWPETERAAGAAEGFKIRYTDYDWSLNEQPSK